MGIKGVVLKHHGDIAVLGGDFVDPFPVDIDRPPSDFFQSRHHPEGGGLATARWADQNHEFPVLDFKVGVVDSHFFGATLLPRIDFIEILD